MASSITLYENQNEIFPISYILAVFTNKLRKYLKSFLSVEVYFFIMGGAKARLEVITPILASLKKEQFSFRLFATYDWKDHVLVDLERVRAMVEKEVNKSKENKKDITVLIEEKKDEIEEELLKKGYIKLDYLFPRTDFMDTKSIDWFSYFAYPLRIVLSKRLGIAIKLKKVEPNDVKIGLRNFLYTVNNKKVPVFYESVLPGSTFEFELEILHGKITKKEEEIEIGAKKNVGFGRCKLAFL